jgi:hypothetical protein
MIYMEFSKAGIGRILGHLFDEEARREMIRRPQFQSRGETIFILGDMGGAHAGQLFETYSFLVTDIDRNSQWLNSQRLFRTGLLRDRRMAFKSLNDRLRKRALIPFLKMGEEIDGWLITFAISRSARSAFEMQANEADFDKCLAGWKASVRERLLRVLHFSAFLLSGLSAPGQNLFWIIDEDAVAANVQQLTELTNLFATVLSNSIDFSLGHVRCGTAKSDDGSLALEDLLAYSDLAAGAVAEIVTTTAPNHALLKNNLVTLMPSSLSWKARMLASWLGSESGNLRRLICVVTLRQMKPKSHAMILRFRHHSMFLPDAHLIGV